jgi:hypothetical protein
VQALARENGMLSHVHSPGRFGEDFTALLSNLVAQKTYKDCDELFEGIRQAVCLALVSWPTDFKVRFAQWVLTLCRGEYELVVGRV